MENIHHKILFYNWSSFFSFLFCWIILFLFCTLHLLTNKRKHADSSQRFNKNYKDGLELKMQTIGRSFRSFGSKKRSSGSTSQKKKLILRAQMVKLSHAFWWWMGNSSPWNLKPMAIKWDCFAFAPDRGSVWIEFILLKLKIKNIIIK